MAEERGQRENMIKWFKRRKKEEVETAEVMPEIDQQHEDSDLGESEEPVHEDESSGLAATEQDQLAEPDYATTAECESEQLDSEDAEQEKVRFFRKLRSRLQKTRMNFVDRVDRIVLGKKTIDIDLLDELEEILITSDLGVTTTRMLLDRVADKIRRKELDNPEKLRYQIREEIKAILSVPAAPWDLQIHHPFVCMIIGVNGVGKTTTIGKLAHQMKQRGLRVMLGAGDTFRAAAIEQLALWGERADVPVIRQKSGSDPSAVAYDAIEAAISRDTDIILLDTAGRMHTKVNLMEELKKIQRVVGKRMPSAPHDILLVLDATTGQNALSQARLFKQEIGVTGLILTKLDGTAKGGIIVAICNELKVPVRYIGIGEGVQDLRPFDAEEFTNALF
jgi:fused signal recognition particle receptor